MRVRGRHEIRLESINVNSGFPAPVQSSVQASLLQKAWALFLSSKSQNNIILGKSFYQSLKDVYFFNLLKYGASDSTVVKDVTKRLLSVLKY